MTKLQRIYVLSGITVVLTGVLVAVLWLPSRPSPGSDIGSAWSAIKTNAARRDAIILDAVIGDALTNRMLLSTMEFYGGASNRTVRYTGFPVGYKPTVPGYEFVALPSGHATGRKLTISLGDLWIDRVPPKDTFPIFSPEAPKRGALLGIYNSGDGTIGGCTVGYEIQETARGWSVRCAGYIDP